MPFARSVSSHCQRAPVASAPTSAGLAQSHRFVGVTASGGEQRAAPFVARRDQELPLRGVGPFVEQARSRPPIPDAQLELAQMQAQDDVGPQLAALVREGEQPREAPAGLVDLPSPGEAEARHAVDRVDEVEGGAGRSMETFVQVVDRTSAECPRPGEAVERESLHLGSDAARRIQRFVRPPLGCLDPLDARGGRVNRLLRQHMRAQPGIVRCFRERQLQVPLVVVDALDASTLGQQELGADPRGAAEAASRSPARSAP